MSRNSLLRRERRCQRILRLLARMVERVTGEAGAGCVADRSVRGSNRHFRRMRAHMSLSGVESSAQESAS